MKQGLELDYEIDRERCFAYCKRENPTTGKYEERCRALNHVYCRKEGKCRFFKDKTETSYSEIEKAVALYRGLASQHA